jgi:hypothetical protein
MENQTAEPASANEKKPFLNIFTIIAIIAVLAFVGYIIFGKKIFTKPANNGVANLSWSANTESDLTGYRIYYGTSPRTGNCPPAGYPEKTDVGKTNNPGAPTQAIENLTPGKTYYFSISSYDISGNESCFFEEVSKSIPK